MISKSKSYMILIYGANWSILPVSMITNKEPDITPESVAIISDLYACDAAKARKQLAYKTRDFSTTLDDTLQYLKSENIIN